MTDPISRETEAPAKDEPVGPLFPSGTNTVEAGQAGALDVSGQPVDYGDEAAPSRAAALKSGTDDDDELAIAPGSGYDPTDNTVDDVLAYVDKHPDEADRVLAAEKAGKNRTTLVGQLEAR
jgi:hypothetical protein